MSELDHNMQLQHWDGKLLSPRQREVCALIVEGLTSREIAERLQITVHTVKAHRAEIMDRMGVDSIAELVRHWIAGQFMTAP